MVYGLKDHIEGDSSMIKKYTSSNPMRQIHITNDGDADLVLKIRGFKDGSGDEISITIKAGGQWGYIRESVGFSIETTGTSYRIDIGG